MKITLIGATGFVGSAVLKELLSRNFEVKAIVRNPEKITAAAHLKIEKGDIMNTSLLAEQMKGSDIIISAYNAGATNPDLYNEFLKGSQSIEQAVEQSGVKRLIVMSGAGSLFIKPGVQLVDTPEFPEAWKKGALATRDYFNILKKNTLLDWTLVSPAIELLPATVAPKKGQYRIGLESPVFDAHNKSSISVEDLAMAIVDEAENSNYIRLRFTVGY